MYNAPRYTAFDIMNSTDNTMIFVLYFYFAQVGVITIPDPKATSKMSTLANVFLHTENSMLIKMNEKIRFPS